MRTRGQNGFKKSKIFVDLINGSPFPPFSDVFHRSVCSAAGKVRVAAQSYDDQLIKLREKEGILPVSRLGGGDVTSR